MILVADNIQAMNPRVSDAIKQMDPEPIREIALAAERAGAKILDINPGYLSRRHEDRIVFLIETVQEVTDLRLMIDSANPDVLVKGAGVCRQKPILNALSLEPHKLDTLLPLAAEVQTDLVLLLMDDDAMSPPRTDEKIAIALELRERCLAAGIDESLLIYDPVLPTLRGPDAFFHVGQCVQTIRLLSSGVVLGDAVRTMIGLSNLRSGQRKLYPDRLDEICLSMMGGAGLSLALADALNEKTVAALRIVNQLSS